MIPISGFTELAVLCALSVMAAESILLPSLQKENAGRMAGLTFNEALILRRFLPRRDFSALLPRMPELTD